MKRYHPRKVMSLTMVCLTLVLALAACGGNDGTSEKTNATTNGADGANSSATSGGPSDNKKLSGSIEVGTLNTEPDAIEKSVAEQIMKNNPGTDIKFVFVNTKARPSIDQRWRAGNPPTIDYQIFNGMIPKTYDFVKQDKILDLTPYLKQKAADQDMTWEETFLPNIKPMLTYEGKYYAIPVNVSIFVLYYNKKMFDDLGLTPPKTWDDFLAVCEVLKKNNIDPVAVTGQFNPYMQMWTDYLLQREAGYDETVKAMRGGGFKNNPKFLEAARKLEDMVKKGYFLKGFEGTDFTAAQMAYIQGKAGMILMGSWLSSEMKESTPKDFQMGVVPFPAINGGQGKQDAMHGSAIMMSVAKSDKNPDLAIEYMKQMTSKSIQTRMANEQNIIPAIKGVEISDRVIGLKDALGSGDLVMRYLGIENDTELFNNYGVAVSKLFFGKITAEQFIDEIDGIARKYGK